jgi:hypothetical protein
MTRRAQVMKVGVVTRCVKNVESMVPFFVLSNLSRRAACWGEVVKGVSLSRMTFPYLLGLLHLYFVACLF